MTKHQIWHAIQRTNDEALIAFVRQLGARFGIDAIVLEHDGQRMEWERQ